MKAGQNACSFLWARSVLRRRKKNNHSPNAFDTDTAYPCVCGAPIRGDRRRALNGRAVYSHGRTIYLNASGIRSNVRRTVLRRCKAAAVLETCYAAGDGNFQNGF